MDIRGKRHRGWGTVEYRMVLEVVRKERDNEMGACEGGEKQEIYTHHRSEGSGCVVSPAQVLTVRYVWTCTLMSAYLSFSPLRIPSLSSFPCHSFSPFDFLLSLSPPPAPLSVVYRELISYQQSLISCLSTTKPLFIH